MKTIGKSVLVFEVVEGDNKDTNASAAFFDGENLIRLVSVFGNIPPLAAPVAQRIYESAEKFYTDELDEDGYGFFRNTAESDDIVYYVPDEVVDKYAQLAISVLTRSDRTPSVDGVDVIIIES